MIQFITAPSDSATVEDAMNYVNNYANISDIGLYKNTGKEYSIQKEYEILMGIAGKINRDYTIVADSSASMKTYGKNAKLKSCVKKITRKLFGWYLRDLATQQTQFNSQVAKFVNQQMLVVSIMNQELLRLQQEVKSGKKRGGK